MNELGPHRHHIFFVINCSAADSIARLILEFGIINRRQGYGEW